MGSLASAGAALRSSALASPNDTVRVACVGVHGQGRTHIRRYSEMPNVEIAAICDVDESVLNARVAELEKAGAVRLNPAQLERLTKEAFAFKEGQGAGCPEPVINKALIGKDAAVLAKAAGASVPDKTELLFAETAKDHVFVKEEQMMPFIPIVRVKTVEEGIEAALVAEHNYKHTSIIHSHDVENMTAMARALDTTLFIKNGPCMAGLGLGGEGYLSYSIATPTGEGVTNPRTFTRVRRCVMVDNLRIY